MCKIGTARRNAPLSSSYEEFLYQGRVSIKYREHRQGRPCALLFIHGFGAASHYRRPLEEHLV